MTSIASNDVVKFLETGRLRERKYFGNFRNNSFIINTSDFVIMRFCVVITKRKADEHNGRKKSY